jgi:hypothetical protein
MVRTLLAIALTAILAACSAERAPATDTTAPNDGAAAIRPGSDAPPATGTPPSTTEPGTPATETPSSDTPPGQPPADRAASASFTGYADVKFGTAAADMEKAWGGELATVGKEFNPDCYFMTPTWVKVPAEFNFMIADGKFARFSTESPKYAAPGGGRIGMSKAEIARLYAAVEAQPHKYTDGEYLRVKDPAGGAGVLVFETDAQGDAAKVTEWRVGVPPQVDYVEGCS